MCRVKTKLKTIVTNPLSPVVSEIFSVQNGHRHARASCTRIHDLLYTIPQSPTFLKWRGTCPSCLMVTAVMWDVCQRDVEGRTVAQLLIHHAQEEDFHVYTIVAENSVSVAAKDVPLVHSQFINAHCVYSVLLQAASDHLMLCMRHI